jgi:hypothetical protein
VVGDGSRRLILQAQIKKAQTFEGVVYGDGKSATRHQLVIAVGPGRVENGVSVYRRVNVRLRI